MPKSHYNNIAVDSSHGKAKQASHSQEMLKSLAVNNCDLEKP